MRPEDLRSRFAIIALIDRGCRPHAVTRSPTIYKASSRNVNREHGAVSTPIPAAVSSDGAPLSPTALPIGTTQEPFSGIVEVLAGGPKHRAAAIGADLRILRSIAVFLGCSQILEFQ